MLHIARLLVVTILFSSFAVAQTQPTKEPSEDNEKLRKDAVVFLRETLTDVNTMRSLENRISFTAELASLMWFHDEREARSMYGVVINDFRDLLTRYDAMINSFGLTPDDVKTGSMSPFSFMMEPTEKSRLLRKMATALGVRQQIAMSVAEHDAELAFAFYNESLAAISNPEFRKQAETGSENFETQIISQISEGSAAKAAQYAIKSVGKGLTYAHVELLKKIHAKDPEKGAEFAAAILGRARTEKSKASDDYILSSLIEFGAKTLETSRRPGGRRPAFTQAEIREIVEILALGILSRSEADGQGALNYVSLIQRYSPARAAQIRAKFRQRPANSNTNAMMDVYTAMGAPMPPPPVARGRNANTNSNTAFEDDPQEKAQTKLAEDLKALEKKELPKEEREKFIAEARKIIVQTPGREKKITALSMLATQVAKLGDKDLASEIMRDAQALVTPSPKTYQDFLLTWMLVSGYATTDPDKAYPLLEETIGRANETLAAFVKVGEFIDVAEEMIQDGEVQVGGFGGSMVRGMTRELSMADSTIKVLARADFAKMKIVTNRFERPEIRVLAKMMVLRAVLDPKDRKPGDEGLKMEMEK